MYGGTQNTYNSNRNGKHYIYDEMHDGGKINTGHCAYL